MKLFYTPMANYIHRVEIVAIEAGIYDEIELIATVPWESPKDLLAANPLRKVSTLVRYDGVPMFGGPVIYEFIDSLHDGPKMFPRDGEARWTALRLLGLGEGMFDSADLRAVELRRPENERSPDAIDRYHQAVLRGLDRLENEAANFDGFHIGLISIAGVLMWIDWLRDTRGTHEDWRLGRPTLAAWYVAFVERPSYQRRKELHPAQSA